MDDYYVNDNAQSNGDHEVHKTSCAYFPSNRTYLGRYSNCFAAVAAAKQRYWQSNGCRWCCPECHTS